MTPVPIPIPIPVHYPQSGSTESMPVWGFVLVMLFLWTLLGVLAATVISVCREDIMNSIRKGSHLDKTLTVIMWTVFFPTQFLWAIGKALNKRGGEE